MLLNGICVCNESCLGKRAHCLVRIMILRMIIKLPEVFMLINWQGKGMCVLEYTKRSDCRINMSVCGKSLNGGGKVILIFVNACVLNP